MALTGLVMVLSDPYLREISMTILPLNQNKCSNTLSFDACVKILNSLELRERVSVLVVPKYSYG